MASITPYETSAGRRYRVRYRKPNGSQTSKRGFTTKRDANNFLNSVEVSKVDGTYMDPTRGKVTIDELCEAWLKRQTHWKESHRYAVEASWRNHVKPRWGTWSASAITRTDVADWVADMSREGKSRTVIMRALGILSGALADAVDDRVIAMNPAEKVKNLPAKNATEKIYLTHDEVWQFADHCGPYRSFVLLLAYTGLRWGEATALKAKHINLARRRLSVEENAVAVGGKIVTGTPKSHERRVVPLPKFLVPMLYEIIAELEPDDLLFTREDGRHLLRPKTGRSWWAKALRESNIEKAPTPHSMRHTAASLAIQAGVNIKALQRMLGHASAALTLDRYGHLYPDDLEMIANEFDTAVATVVATKSSS
jgi:integrase